MEFIDMKDSTEGRISFNVKTSDLEQIFSSL